MRTQPSGDGVDEVGQLAGLGGSIAKSRCAARKAATTSSPSCGSSEQTE